MEIESVRELLSLQKRLKKEEHSLKVRIRNCLLAKYFPELDRVYKRAEQEKRLKNIHNLTGESIGCKITQSAVIEGEILVDRIREIKESLKKIEGVVVSICMELPGYDLLLTIPGFGIYVSSVVLARIGNPFRFKTQSQVIKLSEYDLGAMRSGKNAKSKVPGISKRGHTELRYALHQAAHSASIHDNIFMHYYTNLLKERKAEKGIDVKMRVKLAVKMLVIAWTMLKNNETFDPNMININAGRRDKT